MLRPLLFSSCLLSCCLGARRPLKLHVRGGASGFVRVADKTVGVAGLATTLALLAVPDWALSKVPVPKDEDTLALVRTGLAGFVGVFLFAATARNDVSLLNAQLASTLALAMTTLQRYHRKPFAFQAKADLVACSLMSLAFFLAKIDRVVSIRAAHFFGAALATLHTLTLACSPQTYLTRDATRTDYFKLAALNIPGTVGFFTLCMGGLDTHLEFKRLAFRAIFLSGALLVVLTHLLFFEQYYIQLTSWKKSTTPAQQQQQHYAPPPPQHMPPPPPPSYEEEEVYIEEEEQ